MKQKDKTHLDEIYEARARLNAQLSKMPSSERTKFIRDRVAQYKANQAKPI
jgi:hypothetical protein